jgi:hypothetical protein
MALAEELPVYTASYDLLLAIFTLAKNFRKEFKYTLGVSIKNETVAAVRNIYRANCTTAKMEYIRAARENVEVFRMFFCVAGGLPFLRWGLHLSRQQRVRVEFHGEHCYKRPQPVPVRLQ